MSPEALPGYLSREYAASFAPHARLLELPTAQGWLLDRPVPGTGSFRDAMGCYPLFCCRNWAGLETDLRQLADRVVSLVLVTDPSADLRLPELEKWFELVRPHKAHFVVETDAAPRSFVNASHRRHALRALQDVRVDLCDHPLEWLDEWMSLYEVLVARHGIGGLKRFSRAAFERQLGIPGLFMFRSSIGGRTVGLDLWYVQGDVAHGHLVAFNDEGYARHAAYASKWFLLEFFRGRVRMLNLGAGRNADASDGLSYFKQGFATGTRPTWLCGRVFRPDVYAELVAGRASATDYFPAYRSGELA